MKSRIVPVKVIHPRSSILFFLLHLSSTFPGGIGESHCSMEAIETSSITSSLVATLTSTALAAVNTSLGDPWSDWEGGDISSNGTATAPDEAEISEGSYVLVCLISAGTMSDKFR